MFTAMLSRFVFLPHFLYKGLPSSLSAKVFTGRTGRRVLLPLTSTELLPMASLYLLQSRVTSFRTRWKVTFTLEETTKAQRKSRDNSSTFSLTLALDADGWSAPRPGRFTPWKIPGAHFICGCVGPRAGLDLCGKTLPPLTFDPRTVRPIASRCIDYDFEEGKLKLNQNLIQDELYAIMKFFHVFKRNFKTHLKT